MPDNKRESLKTLLLGTAIGSALPHQWAKPVVNSVLLPSHALTSNALTSNDPTCTSFMIPGRSMSCTDAAFTPIATRYSIDDSGDCPVLGSEILQVSIPNDPPPPNSFQIVVYDIYNPLRALTQNSRGIYTPNDGAFIPGILCNNSDDSLLGQTSFGSQSFSIMASSGAAWQGEWSSTSEVSGVAFSDIVFSPAL